MQRLLREGLLEGRRVVLVGPARAELRDTLSGLGAEILDLEPDLSDDDANAAAAQALGAVHVLVVDGEALFAGADTAADELGALRRAADGAWAAARAVANAAWIEPGSPGKIVLVAPPPDLGPHAEATVSAYENLARTTSIEWSRYGIKPTAITASTTPPADVATVVAYLVSPAGDYFSGARLDLV
jgi:citronellol/citronellal dehydrogenase